MLIRGCSHRTWYLAGDNLFSDFFLSFSSRFGYFSLFFVILGMDQKFGVWRHMWTAHKMKLKSLGLSNSHAKYIFRNFGWFFLLKKRRKLKKKIPSSWSDRVKNKFNSQRQNSTFYDFSQENEKLIPTFLVTTAAL